MGVILALLILFQIKHLVVDFFWQGPYEYLNKGTWLHWGGIQHSGKHAVTTMLILAPFVTFWAVPIALVEFVIHYLTDYSKVNIGKKYGWKADTHKEFWWALGFDQWVHQMTYIIIAFVTVI